MTALADVATIMRKETGGVMALYRCLDSDGERLEKLASENNIKLERMDDDNYTDRCPSCGDSEFWSGGVCHH